MNLSLSGLAQMPVWDPVLKRELLSGLRSSRIRWILLLYLLVPFLVVMLRWPTGRVYYGGSSLAQEVWLSFMVTQALLIMLLTPIFSAYSISSEYEENTVEFLWTTALAPWKIVFNKMVAISLLGAVLIAASVPGLSTVFFLGGVGANEFLIGYAALLLMVSSITALGTFFSALLRKGHLSLLFCYLSLGALMGCFWLFGEGLLVLVFPLGLFLVSVCLSSLNNLKGTAISWWILAVVFLCVIVVAYDPLSAIVGNPFFLRRASLALGFLISFTLVFGWMACFLGSEPVGEDVRANFKPIDNPQIIEYRRNNWPYYLVDPLRRHPPIADDANVVAAHEELVNPLLRTSWSYRILLYPQILIGAMSLSLGGYALSPSETIAPVTWWLCLLAMAPWMILVHAISMTMEDETRTFDSLRLTSVTPMEWLLGKWRLSLRKRWLAMLVGLFSVVLIALLAGHSMAFVFWSGISWWFGVETLGLAVFAIASFCRRTMAAIAFSVVGVIAITYGLYFLAYWHALQLDPLLWDLFYSTLGPVDILTGSVAAVPAKIPFSQTLAWILVGCLAWLVATRTVRWRWKMEVKAT
jgi:hypothetical protein